MRLVSRLPRWLRKLFRLERYSKNWNRVRTENCTPEYIAKLEAELGRKR